MESVVMKMKVDVSIQDVRAMNTVLWMSDFLDCEFTLVDPRTIRLQHDDRSMERTLAAAAWFQNREWQPKAGK